MREKPKILAAKTIAQTRVFRVDQVDLLFSNGTNAQYECLIGSTHGAVLVVPMRDDATVLLIREYAVGMDRYEIALPKGRIESGENPIAAANREMMEEVGYGARRLRHITSLTVAPGYMRQITHVVLAEQLFEQRAAGDEPEEIEVIPWRLDDLDRLLRHDECTEARSIAALYIVRDLLQRERGERT